MIGKLKNQGKFLTLLLPVQVIWRCSSKFKSEKIVGVDISAKMLEAGRVKVEARRLNNILSLQQGDSEQL